MVEKIKKVSKESLALTYEDRPGVPTIYIDGLSGVIQASGVVKLRFYESVLGGGFGDDGKGCNRTILHLAMAIPTLLAIHGAIERFLKDMEADQRCRELHLHVNRDRELLILKMSSRRPLGRRDACQVFCHSIGR